jgi:hypothetical protein
MKSTLYIVNAVMVVAIVILFVLFFGNKQEEKTVAPVQVEGGVSVA